MVVVKNAKESRRPNERIYLLYLFWLHVFFQDLNTFIFAIILLLAFEDIRDTHGYIFVVISKITILFLKQNYYDIMNLSKTLLSIFILQRTALRWWSTRVCVFQPSKMFWEIQQRDSTASQRKKNEIIVSTISKIWAVIAVKSDHFIITPKSLVTTFVVSKFIDLLIKILQHLFIRSYLPIRLWLRLNHCFLYKVHRLYLKIS